MKKTYSKIIKISTRLLTILILVAILCVSCIQIYDRCTFHKHIKKAATEYVDSVNRRQFTLLHGSLCNNRDSVIVKPVVVATNTEGRISLYNNSFNGSSELDYMLHLQNIFDILSKSDGILSANGITFLITLIVSLLVTILINRMEAEQKLRKKINKAQNNVEQAIKDIDKSKNDIEQALKDIKEVTDETKDDKIRTKNLFSHFTRYNNVLIRLVSIYNLGIIIGDMIISLSPNKSPEENTIISTTVGELCSRLSLTCNEILTLFNDPKHKLDYLTIDEKEILYRYLTDALGELERSRDRDIARYLGITALCNLVENNIYIVEDIKDNLDCIELKEDFV